jgi:dienelactone hydrolase
MDGMQESADRRTFLQAGGAAAAAGLGLLLDPRPAPAEPAGAGAPAAAAAAPPPAGPPTVPQNMLGEFGPWARDLLGEGPARLSFRRPEFDRRKLVEWREKARARLRECIAMPESGGVPRAEVVRRAELDGVEAELLRWQLPYGPPSEAVFLKPAGARGRLPAVLALHDHSGKKYFGHRKIARLTEDVHPLVREHVTENYGGLWWANELARRGYAVLAPDAFLFGSRRVRLPDVPRVLSGLLVEPPDPEEGREIVSYNRWAAQHEHVVARSLFCAGTTLPGVVLGEDQRALDYLCSRAEVDPGRVGCCGLSSGGLRSLYLAGLDDRIAAAVCVGMMTTWRDFCFAKSYTHTWMIYPPGLPRDLDYPEILGLRVPLPTLVQNCRQDALFSPPEVDRADRMLAEIYEKAGAENRYRCSFYPGTHRFDRDMQAEAFAWLDNWLAGK